MKHKDGLDIAAVLLLLLASVAVMVVPVALVRPQLLAVPAMLVLIALCVVLYQRRRLRTFLAKQLCSTEFETAASSTALPTCLLRPFLSTMAASCGTTSISKSRFSAIMTP